MGAVGWIIVGVVLAPIAFFLLKALLASSLPIETSGRLYLRKKLADLGVPADRLSDAFIDDIVGHAADFGRLVKGSGFAAKSQTVETLDGIANVIATIILFEDDPLFRNSWTFDLMVKHGLVDPSTRSGSLLDAAVSQVGSR